MIIQVQGLGRAEPTLFFRFKVKLIAMFAVESVVINAWYAYIVMAYIVMAYIVMACIVMAYIVMAYIVVAYTVMTCTVLVFCRSRRS